MAYLIVNDGTEDSISVETLAVVYDPIAGFVTGGGRFVFTFWTFTAPWLPYNEQSKVLPSPSLSKKGHSLPGYSALAGSFPGTLWLVKLFRCSPTATTIIARLTTSIIGSWRAIPEISPAAKKYP